MDTLRWILLIIGILVLVAIYLLGRRSERDARRQGRDDDEYAPRFDDAVEDLHEPEPDVLGLSAGEPAAEEEADDWLDNVRPFRPRAERLSNPGPGGEEGPQWRPRPTGVNDPVVELRPRRESEASPSPHGGDSVDRDDWFESAGLGDRSAREGSDSANPSRERTESPLERWMSDSPRQADPPTPSSVDPGHEAPAEHDPPADLRALRDEGTEDGEWVDEVRPIRHEAAEDDGWVEDVRPIDHEATEGDEWVDDVRPIRPETAEGDEWVDDVRTVHREVAEDESWVDDVRPVRREHDAPEEPTLDPVGGETDLQEPRLAPPPASLAADASMREEPSLFDDAPAEGEPDEDGWVDDVRPISRDVTAETEQERRPREIPDRVASALDSAEEEARRRAEAPEMPDDVLIMHIVPADSAHGYFSGQDLRSAFEAFGLSYGPMDIFHRDAGVGLPMFSVINRIKPGTFDLESMDEIQTPGFSLFMQMPGPDQPMVAFRAMCDCARRLAERLRGRLQDEHGEPMTVQTFNRYEKRVRVFVSGLYRRFGSAGVEPEHAPPESPLSTLREQSETLRTTEPVSRDAPGHPDNSATPVRAAERRPAPDIPAWAREIREEETDGSSRSDASREGREREIREALVSNPRRPQGAQKSGKQAEATREQREPGVAHDATTAQRDAPWHEDATNEAPPRDRLHEASGAETNPRPRRAPPHEQSFASEAPDSRRAPAGRDGERSRSGMSVERDLFDDDETGGERPDESASARAGAITRKLIERYEDRVRTFVSGLSRHAQDEDDALDVLMNEAPPREASRPEPAAARFGEHTVDTQREIPLSASAEEEQESAGEPETHVRSSLDDTLGRRDPPQRRSLVERAASMRKPRPPSREKVRVEPEPGMPEELLIIHLVADPSVGTFGGEHIAEAFDACDLTFGAMQIYHREAGTGKPMFSVVNMLKPGTFDPAHFHEMETPGISLFMQLPGPDQPMVAFRNMRDCARRLAESLGGRLEDETHSTMTTQTLSHYEERVRSFIQRQARHAGGRRW